MKSIIFCRHAKSDWGPNVSDLNRPLNKRGIVDAPMMGRVLKGYNYSPDLILSSPALRALTTSQLVARELSYPEKDIKIQENFYFKGMEQIFDTIRQVPGSVNHLMIFGHNPVTEDIVSHLLGASTSGVIFPTAGMAAFDYPYTDWDNLRPNAVSLKWFLIPKLVKNSFS